MTACVYVRCVFFQIWRLQAFESVAAVTKSDLWEREVFFCFKLGEL